MWVLQNTCDFLIFYLTTDQRLACTSSRSTCSSWRIWLRFDPSSRRQNTSQLPTRPVWAHPLAEVALQLFSDSAVSRWFDATPDLCFTPDLKANSVTFMTLSRKLTTLLSLVVSVNSSKSSVSVAKASTLAPLPMSSVKRAAARIVEKRVKIVAGFILSSVVSSQTLRFINCCNNGQNWCNDS